MLTRNSKIKSFKNRKEQTMRDRTVEIAIALILAWHEWAERNRKCTN